MPPSLRSKPFLLVSGLWPVLAMAHGAPAHTPAESPALPLQASLQAEFALQSGRLDEAAQAYLQAALASGRDTRLSERATRIAILANDRALAQQALTLWQAQSPHAPGARASAAALALRDGDVPAAQALLAGLMQDPDPLAWRQALGALVNAAGNQVAVAAAVEGLLQADQLPPKMELWQELGRLLLRFEQPGLVAAMVPAAVRRFPDDPRVALLHGHQLYSSGQTDQALAVLAPVQAQVAADPALRNALAAQYDAMGQWALAAQVMAQGSQDVQSWGLRAALLVRQRDLPGLTALYETLVADAGSQPDAAQRLLLGKIAQYLERPEQALDWYRAVASGPERGEARLRAITVLYHMGRVAQALAESRALQDEAAVDKEVRRDAYLAEAELHSLGNDPDSELKALMRGLAAFPGESALLYARGLYWERQDDVLRAEADLQALLLQEPDSAAALNALGYILADRTERYQEALALIDRARLAEPDNAAIIDSYGWVLYRLGRHEQALEQLQRAWSLQRDAEVGAHLAEVLLVLGRREQAEAVYRQAVALDPESRAVQLLGDRLGP